MTDLGDRYRQALTHYVAGNGEVASLEAYELGRQALADRHGVIELAAIHSEAVIAILSEPESAQQAAGLLKQASEFFAECISPFEMAQRGYREVNATLQQLNEALQCRNADLDEANRKLTEGSRLKSQFLANVSHELRTPLNAIIGFSRLLAREAFGPLQPVQQQYVANILQSGRHLLSLINELLDLSKIEAGKMELQLGAIDVARLLAETASLIQGMADQKQITVENPIPGPLRAFADLSRVRQILLNLLSNAIKFTPDGGRVSLRAAVVGDFVQISVEDNGIGIAQKDQERIFEEFEQVDGTPSREFGGTGLGLALSRKLALLQGGKLVVASQVGKGSTFTLFIPLQGIETAAA